jgi:hypothetical protein
MADHEPLTPERLSHLLNRLDEVMTDAAPAPADYPPVE